jgi:hypothetical protein
LMCTDKARKGGAVNEYMLHEMARIRIDELREEDSHARVGRRGDRGGGVTASASWPVRGLPVAKPGVSLAGRWRRLVAHER